MAKKAYVCNKYPDLRVRDLKFSSGLFVAKNKDEQRIIENAHGYKVFIWPKDEDEPVAEPAALTGEEAEALALAQQAMADPQVRQGRLGTGVSRK